MQPELHWFTQQTDGLNLLLCQMYSFCFVTDSALMLNTYTLIRYAKVKKESRDSY